MISWDWRLFRWKYLFSSQANIWRELASYLNRSCRFQNLAAFSKRYFPTKNGLGEVPSVDLLPWTCYLRKQHALQFQLCIELPFSSRIKTGKSRERESNPLAAINGLFRSPILLISSLACLAIIHTVLNVITIGGILRESGWCVVLKLLCKAVWCIDCGRRI